MEIEDLLGVLLDESAIDGNLYGEFKLLDGESLDIPEAFTQTLAKIDDKKPMFVNYAVPSGYSRKMTAKESEVVPHRFWPADKMYALVDKVNVLGEQGTGLPGNRGHPSSDGALKELPDPAVLWVKGAKAVNVNTGLETGILRGYVYDVNNTRTFMRTGAFNTASVIAAVEGVTEMHNGHSVFVVKEANFLGVDLVRKGTEGIRGTKQLSIEGANMELTAEQIQLLATLTKEMLALHNPKLVSDLSTEAAKITPDNKQLLDTLQQQLIANAGLLRGKTIADEAAKALGITVDELPGKISYLQGLAKKEISLAIESAVKDINPAEFRDVVKKQLELNTFTSVDEVKTTVESAINNAKSMLAAFGIKYGEINTNEPSKPSTGLDTAMISPSMRKRMEARNG